MTPPFLSRLFFPKRVRQNWQLRLLRPRATARTAVTHGLGNAHCQPVLTHTLTQKIGKPQPPYQLQNRYSF